MLFRKAILLIHGFAGGTWDYGTLGNNLQLYLDFDVYTFTLPGHDKPMITKVTKDDWITAAENQIEILIKHGYKKIYLIGHSMGGVIACHLAQKYPQVKKLVLVSPAFRYLSFKNDKFDLIGSIKKAPGLIKDYSLETCISRAFKMSIHASSEFMKLVEEHHKDPREITCPVLIIHGTKDLMAPLDSGKYVYKNLKSTIAIFIKLKDATHDVFMGERKNEAEQLIINFLRHTPTKDTKEEKTI